MRTTTIRHSETLMSGLLHQTVRVTVSDDKGNATYAEFKNTNIFGNMPKIENDRLVLDASGDFVIDHVVEEWTGTLHHVSKSRRYITWNVRDEQDLLDKIEKWAKTCSLFNNSASKKSLEWVNAI